MDERTVPEQVREQLIQDDWVKTAGGRTSKHQSMGPDPKKVAKERAKNKMRRRSRQRNR